MRRRPTSRVPGCPACAKVRRVILRQPSACTTCRRPVARPRPTPSPEGRVNPTPARSFDPNRVGTWEWRAWVAYCRRQWATGVGGVGRAGARRVRNELAADAAWWVPRAAWAGPRSGEEQRHRADDHGSLQADDGHARRQCTRRRPLADDQHEHVAGDPDGDGRLRQRHEPDGDRCPDDGRGPLGHVANLAAFTPRAPPPEGAPVSERGPLYGSSVEGAGRCGREWSASLDHRLRCATPCGVRAPRGGVDDVLGSGNAPG